MSYFASGRAPNGTVGPIAGFFDLAGNRTVFFVDDTELVRITYFALFERDTERHWPGSGAEAIRPVQVDRDARRLLGLWRSGGRSSVCQSEPEKRDCKEPGVKTDRRLVNASCSFDLFHHGVLVFPSPSGSHIWRYEPFN